MQGQDLRAHFSASRKKVPDIVAKTTEASSVSVGDQMYALIESTKGSYDQTSGLAALTSRLMH